MSSVLITHPYHLALDSREARLGKPYPPLTTLNAATLLKKQGHEVVFLDRTFEPDESDFGSQLEHHRPDFVAVMADDHSVQMKQCIGRIRRAQQSMARQASERGFPVLVSGPDVSDHPALYLSEGATVAVVGESVEVVTEWVRGQKGIEGLHGLDGSGGRRAPVGELDGLPDTDWSLLDLSPYSSQWRGRFGYWELNISTAKGCPYTCNWCAKPTWGRSYQVRSPQRVAAEVDRLRETIAPDRIWFTDDIFAIKPDWLRLFRKHLSAPMPYRCLSRADLLKDPDYTADLKATGCQEVWIGAESGSDKILQAMDKGSDVAEIERARENLKNAGISAGFFLQLGYPGEGISDVRQTIEMVRKLRPEQIGVSVSYPLPGTVFYEHVGHTMQDHHWEEAMDNRPLFQAPFGAEFYGAAKEVLRSTHSAGLARNHLIQFARQRNRRNARQMAGSAWHAFRLPWMRRKMNRFATPNPSAVPLGW